MALVTLIDKITEALDKAKCIIVVFLDFSITFDTVDGILLQKWNYMVYKISHTNGLKIIYQNEFIM